MILGDGMKNSKGFTLVELIAIIILLGAIVTITYTSVSGILNRQKRKVFEESLNGIIDSATIYVTENKYSFTAIEDQVWYENGWNISITSGLIAMNGDSKIESGTVHISKEKEISVVNVYDGEFCGSGTTSNYTIKKGTCS